jgi:hypothetical protein
MAPMGMPSRTLKAAIDDLLELGDRHGVGDVELFAQRLLNFGLVLLL